MDHLVTVIIPVFNLGEYLRKSLPCVLNQTYVNMEILLIDDGSTDDTLNICREYESLDRRIHVIHQKNSGVSAARNTGIDNAQGEYIAFVDGDDIIAPFYIERLVGAVQNSVLAMCMHERVKSYGYLFFDSHEPFESFLAKECAKRLISGKFPVCVWGGIFLRSNIADLRFPLGIRNNEDKYFLYQYLLNNEQGNVAFTNQKLYGYFVREGSATKTAWNGSRDIIIVADHMHELTLNKHPEWANLAVTNQIIVRLNVLKDILRSGKSSRDSRVAFQTIKKEILKMPLPTVAGRTTKIEYHTLKCGGFPYRMLVKSYYGFMSEKMINKKNERVSRQPTREGSLDRQ